MSQIHPGFEIVDLTPGNGITAEVGSLVSIEWRGWRYREDECNRGTFRFQVGDRQLIAEVEQAVVGMQVGGVRRLWFRPQLEAPGPIAGDAPDIDLIHFELRLLAILPETPTVSIDHDDRHPDQGSPLADDADSDDHEDERTRRQILQQMPSVAQLDALIAQRRPSPINYELEDDELPC